MVAVVGRKTPSTPIVATTAETNNNKNEKRNETPIIKMGTLLISFLAEVLRHPERRSYVW